MKVEIEGLKECLASLKDLEPRLQKSIVRKALRAGANVIRKAAQSDAPVQSGLLRKSIKVKAGKRSKHSISINVGVGAKWFTGPAFYGAFVAFGHKVGSRKLGDSRAQVPANDFMSSAYNSSKDAAMSAVISTVENGIDAALEGRE